MRYFLGFLITIGLIVLIIVLLVSGHGSKAPTAKPLRLADYTHSNSSAQILIDGPVNADSKHDSARIVVTSSNVTTTFYTGYQDSVTKSQSYESNQAAYEVFLRALQHAGFTQYDSKVTADERGYCPTGYRYVLGFNSDGKDLRRSWTTRCASSVPRSFPGSVEPIINLFRAQVPDWQKLTSGTQIQ